MEKREFELFKDRLYRVENALKKSLESCPDLENTYIELSDGHRLYPHEIYCWIKAVRAESWKHGPPKSQKLHIKAIVRSQPKG